MFNGRQIWITNKIWHTCLQRGSLAIYAFKRAIVSAALFQSSRHLTILLFRKLVRDRTGRTLAIDFFLRLPSIDLPVSWSVWRADTLTVWHLIRYTLTCFQNTFVNRHLSKTKPPANSFSYGCICLWSTKNTLYRMGINDNNIPFLHSFQRIFFSHIRKLTITA